MHFTWAEGEFDVKGNLIGVLYQTCTTIFGRRTMMVPKGNNLKKHEGI